MEKPDQKHILILPKYKCLSQLTFYLNQKKFHNKYTHRNSLYKDVRFFH
jgi:hypothetical protein